MARVNKAAAPYYDDYDSTKQYTQLLAIPGRVAQAREVTQIQSVVKDIVKSIGDSILKDGSIVEGCQVIVNATKTEVTVTSGKIYINGMVLPVSTSTIPINGVGNELIGAKLNETIITETEDNTLRDPAQGYDNYNQAGCHRVKSWVSITVNDPEAAIIATLIDGSLAVENYAPDYDALTQTLARRTYDESGSYIVDGLGVRVEKNLSDDTKFNVVVESGKAYVLGYELKIPAPRRLVVPRSTTFSSVSASNYWYSTGISDYQLANAPYVKSITSVKGFVSKTVNQTITSNVDRVLLDELEVSQITSVTQGDVIYTVGTENTGDCHLQREGTRYYVKWNGTDNFPILNSSYSVTYTYNHIFQQGKDYELTYNTNTDSHNLTWISGGDTPIPDTNFTVLYDQYLARKDIVYINQYGDIDIVLGNPAEYGFEIMPSAPVNTLPLASIMSPPGGSITSNSSQSIESTNIGLTRFTMNDIQNLLNRIRTLEYDQTILSLNEEARQFETASSKRGIFTDPLIDFSKIDYYYNLSDGVVVDSSKPIYDATLDLLSNICYLPTESKTYDTSYNSASTSNSYGRIATLAKTGESVVLSQMNATKSFLINPYSVFPQLPEISISPAVDTWMEDTLITVPLSQTTSQVVSTSTRHLSSSAVRGGSFSAYTTTSSSFTDTPIGTRVDTNTTESVISEEAITYIRTREIEVEGNHFPANLDNIKGYFDGTYVPLTPTGITSAGTEAGSIKADASGRVTAKFTIPDNVLTGIREFRLESAVEVDGYETSAFALYQASGTRRTIQSTVTTLTTVLLNRVTTVTSTTYIDPVGQTFVLDKMTMISGIDLYFEGKPEGNIPVTCDIREVVNGSITSTIYGHKTLPATSVNISSDSSVATRFLFDEPVLLEENKEYAFVVRSTSANYRIWVADLGGKDVQTGDTVLSNPYLIGVMMSSSNNSSWSMHQTTDIKFRLIADNYSNTSEVLFNEITSAEEFSRIYLLADSIVPVGTSIDWYYSVDSGTSYKELSPYNMTLLDQMKENIIFRAIMNRTSNTSLSPIIALDSVSVELSSYALEGHYITKNITGLDAYTSVDIVIDSYSPSNTTLKVYVSHDNGNTLTLATLDDTSVRTMNYGWKEQTYRATVPSSTECRVFIELESIYKYFTPSFRRLRVIMS